MAKLVENKLAAGRRDGVSFSNLWLFFFFFFPVRICSGINKRCCFCAGFWLRKIQEKQLEKNFYKYITHKISSWYNSVSVRATTPDVNLFRGLHQHANPKVKHSRIYGLLLQLVKWWTSNRNWNISSIMLDKNVTLSLFQKLHHFSF